MSKKYDEGYAMGYANAVHDKKDIVTIACGWLFKHLPIMVDYYDDDFILHINARSSEFIKKFREEMEDNL